jgi:hypothetical protein
VCVNLTSNLHNHIANPRVINRVVELDRETGLKVHRVEQTTWQGRFKPFKVIPFNYLLAAIKHSRNNRAWKIEVFIGSHERRAFSI